MLMKIFGTKPNGDFNLSLCLNSKRIDFNDMYIEMVEMAFNVILI